MAGPQTARHEQYGDQTQGPGRDQPDLDTRLGQRRCPVASAGATTIARAVIGATALGALGYTNVKALVGKSFTGWAESGYTVAEGVPAEGEAYNFEFAEGWSKRSTVP